MASCTVAIPVYNRVSFIRDCINSALAQQVDDLEVLVVDNCSTDGTWELLQTFPDPRLRLIRNERNLGLFGNFNRCLTLVKSPYLRFLCSDDRLPDSCLNAELAFMRSHPEVALLSSVTQYIDSTGRALGTAGDVLPAGIIPCIEAPGAILSTLLRLGINPLSYPSGIMLRTSSVARAGVFDASLRIAGDVDFFIRVLNAGDLAISRAPGALVTRHAHQESQVRLGGSMFVHLREMLALFRRYRQRIPSTFSSSEQVKSALSAHSMWLALACFARKSRAGCRAHLSFSWRIRSASALTYFFMLILLRARYYLRSRKMASRSFIPQDVQ